MQNQHCGGNIKLSMEVIPVEYLPNSVDPGSNETHSEFYSQISYYNEQDACDSNDHMIHVFKKLLNHEYCCLACQHYDNKMMVMKRNNIFIWYNNGLCNKFTWPCKYCFGQTNFI